MERQEQKTNRSPEVAPDAGGEDQTQTTSPEPELEEPGPATPFQRLRAALDKVRQNQKPVASRRELGRDKSKSLFALAGVGIALVLLFFGLFSSPKSHVPLPGENPRGAPGLGRKVTPGQEQNDASKTVTPILNADVRSGDGSPSSQVTPEEVGGTSASFAGSSRVPGANEKPAPGTPRNAGAYALKNVDFSDPAVAQAAAIPAPPPLPTSESASDLKKPSMVFVRSAQGTTQTLQGLSSEGDTLTKLLPAGTRLVARLEAPVSSAAPAPVIAVVEYNYEHDGEIVLPAGARVFGKLSHVSPSGFVGFQFDRVEMPDGEVEKIDATAMDLKFGPLKGEVTGRKRGTNFLVRTMTGLGTVAAFVVGGQGASGFSSPISDSSLLREHIADNIGMAGQDEINMLAANQNIVVTVPGNTRFYVVLEKGSSDQPTGKPGFRSADVNSASLANGRVPTLEELRELMQLKNELNQMYLQSSAQSAPAQQ